MTLSRQLFKLIYYSQSTSRISSILKIWFKSPKLGVNFHEELHLTLHFILLLFALNWRKFDGHLKCCNLKYSSWKFWIMETPRCNCKWSSKQSIYDKQSTYFITKVLKNKKALDLFLLDTKLWTKTFNLYFQHILDIIKGTFCWSLLILVILLMWHSVSTHSEYKMPLLEK